MPSVTEKQRRFMGADLGRLRGRATGTGASEQQLGAFARRLAAADKALKWDPREGRLTAATLLTRRLRFGGEWL